MPTYADKIFYVYPDSTEPERARTDGVYCNLFYQYNSYGDAWIFLLEKYVRRLKQQELDDSN